MYKKKNIQSLDNDIDNNEETLTEDNTLNYKSIEVVKDDVIDVNQQEFVIIEEKVHETTEPKT